MGDDVKAALTARRWAEWLGPSAWETTKGNGFGLYNGEMLIWHDDIAPSPIRGTTRHALAALALYGQPFGFDDEDRALLYLLAEVLPNRGNIAEEHVARIKTMADKVAALLPPEPTDG